MLRMSPLPFAGLGIMLSRENYVLMCLCLPLMPRHFRNIFPLPVTLQNLFRLLNFHLFTHVAIREVDDCQALIRWSHKQACFFAQL